VGVDWIAGVDEVGRGPLAGPVVAAAVILQPSRTISGLADSKKLSPARRVQLDEIIRHESFCWAIGRAEVAEIDSLNILHATMLAMRRAVLALETIPTSVLIDGNRCPELPMPSLAIVKGDSSVPAISAASIIAKVARDQEMVAFDRIYPGYGFSRHKGYGTPEHLACLRKLGPTPIHRWSFAPVRNCGTHRALEDRTPRAKLS